MRERSQGHNQHSFDGHVQPTAPHKPNYLPGMFVNCPLVLRFCSSGASDSLATYSTLWCCWPFALLVYSAVLHVAANLVTETAA